MKKDFETFIGALCVGLLAAILLMGMVQLCHGGSYFQSRRSPHWNSSYIDYPYAEYQGHVLTDLGSFAVYKAKWHVLQREWEFRKKESNIYVLGFSDRKRGELWYTEGVLDRVFEGYRFWKSPRETELKNIGSIKDWNSAVMTDREDEHKVLMFYNEKFIRFDLKDKPIN